MSYLDSFSRGASYLNVGHGLGLTNHLVETGEYLLASYAAGRVNTQFGEHAKFNGVELTYAGGVVGKLLAVGADIMGVGDGWAHHLNTVSTAFLGTHMAAIGAQHGYDAAKAAPAAPRALPASPSAKANGLYGLPAQTSIGAIPPAPQPGKFLDLNEVTRLANMHG